MALKDNDSIAALLAVEINADSLIILSDVDGIYTSPPGEEDSKMLRIFRPSDKNIVRFGPSGSKVGTGGMESKVIFIGLLHFVGVVIYSKRIDTIAVLSRFFGCVMQYICDLTAINSPINKRYACMHFISVGELIFICNGRWYICGHCQWTIQRNQYCKRYCKWQTNRNLFHSC